MNCNQIRAHWQFLTTFSPSLQWTLCPPQGRQDLSDPEQRNWSCHWWRALENVAFNRPAAHMWFIELGQLIFIFLIPIKWSPGGSSIGFIVHCGLAEAVGTSKIVASENKPQGMANAHYVEPIPIFPWSLTVVSATHRGCKKSPSEKVKNPAADSSAL